MEQNSDQNKIKLSVGENPLFIPGPAGQIETVLSMPSDSPSDELAIVCHPHPLERGTMNNKVVTTIGRSFLSLNMPVFRFNFRGVGNSGGEFDDAVGELDDLRAVARHAAKRFPLARLRLAGFSFGSAVSAALANELGAISLLSVAPPVVRWGFEDIDMPMCDWVIVQGEEDEIIDPNAVYEFASTRVFQPRVIRFENTTHFFHGQLTKLKNTLTEYYRQ